MTIYQSMPGKNEREENNVKIKKKTHMELIFPQ